MYKHNRIRRVGGSGGGGGGFLLDGMEDDVGVAFSLRQLIPDFTGDVIGVRRSSDDTVDGFGFINGVLDTDGILAFCGAGSGFVSSWVDQSGNIVDVNNATTAAQPRIVNAGVLDTSNGEPAIFFDGVNDYLFRQGIPPASIVSAAQTDIYGVFLQTAADASSAGGLFDYWGLDGFNFRRLYLSYSGFANQPHLFIPVYFDTGATSVLKPVGWADAQHMMAVYWGSNLCTINVDGVDLIVDDACAGSFDLTDSGLRQLRIGIVEGNYLQGYMQELFWFKANRVDDRAALKTSIMSHYGISA